jgi:hypothetical protein
MPNAFLKKGEHEGKVFISASETQKRELHLHARVFLSFSACVYDKTTRALKLLFTRLV